jgi:hypothetical protein
LVQEPLGIIGGRHGSTLCQQLPLKRAEGD